MGFKVFTTGIAIVTMICTAASGQDDLKQLAAKKDKKLESPFLKVPNTQWYTNYDDALAASKASGKLIFGYFTRSYAPCGPCLQLEQTVLARPEFVEFSKDVILLCHISARIPGDPHNFLFAEKGGSAFPTLMVLDGAGNVLARQCGERSMRAVRDTVAEGQRVAEMIRRADVCECGQEVELQFECLCRQIELGHLTPEAARAKVTRLEGISADRKAFLESSIISRECSVALLEIRKAPDEPAQLKAAKRLVDMSKAGRVPSDANVFSFWDWVMFYAHRNGDIRLYEEGVIAMKALIPNDGERLREKEDVLQRMKREVRLGGSAIIAQ